MFQGEGRKDFWAKRTQVWVMVLEEEWVNEGNYGPSSNSALVKLSSGVSKNSQVVYS